MVHFSRASKILGERGAQERPAALLQARAIGGGDPDGGGQIDAVEVGLARAAGAGVGRARFVAQAPPPRPRAWAQRDAALDRCGRSRRSAEFATGRGTGPLRGGVS